MVAIVRFRGDKLYNEHIYWDQASVLVQVGALDPGTLPVAGIETAKKMVDETPAFQHADAALVRKRAQGRGVARPRPDRFQPNSG